MLKGTIMYQAYIDHMKQMSEQMQKPIKELLTLQVRTLQKISYIKPDELGLFKKPEDLIDHQRQILFQNSHLFVEYMAHALMIFERHLVSLSHPSDQVAEEIA